MRKRIVFLLAVSLFSSACSDSFKANYKYFPMRLSNTKTCERPFSQTKITPEQIRNYLERIKQKLGAVNIPVENGVPITVMDVRNDTSRYMFTTAGPAHPSVIIFCFEPDKNHHVQMTILGYTAGNEIAFSNWFREVAREEALFEHPDGMTDVAFKIPVCTEADGSNCEKLGENAPAAQK